MKYTIDLPDDLNARVMNLFSEFAQIPNNPYLSVEALLLDLVDDASAVWLDSERWEKEEVAAQKKIVKLICQYCGTKFEGLESDPCPTEHDERYVWVVPLKDHVNAKADYEEEG